MGDRLRFAASRSVRDRSPVAAPDPPTWATAVPGRRRVPLLAAAFLAGVFGRRHRHLPLRLVVGGLFAIVAAIRCRVGHRLRRVRRQRGLREPNGGFRGPGRNCRRTGTGRRRPHVRRRGPGRREAVRPTGTARRCPSSSGRPSSGRRTWPSLRARRSTSTCCPTEQDWRNLVLVWLTRPSTSGTRNLRSNAVNPVLVWIGGGIGLRHPARPRRRLAVR